MKRIVSILLLLAMVAGIAACSGSTPPPAAPAKDATPVAAFDLPSPGSVLPFGPVQVVVHAESASGISAIELSAGGAVLTTWATPNPSQTFVVYEHVWTPAAAGDVALTVRAKGSNGVWGSKSSMSVKVQPAAETPTWTLEATPEPTLEPTLAETTPAPTATSLLLTPTETFTPSPAPAVVAPGIEIYPVLSAHRFYDFYSNERCNPRNAGVSVTVSDPSQVYSVIIFFRVIDRFTYAIGRPTSGFALGPTKYGAYYMVLTSRLIADPMPHVPSRVWYQFVATDVSGAVLARTPYYTDMDILNCDDPR